MPGGCWLLVLAMVATTCGSQPHLDLPELASLIAGHWRTLQPTDRAGQLGTLLSRSQVIIIPKLEITSPTFPPDGGSFILSADIPINLGGGWPQAANRNSSSSSSSGAGASAAPAPPPTDGDTLRNPSVVMSYGRRAGRDRPLSATAGLHDLLAVLLDGSGSGSGCLLRLVCELAGRPLRSNGLLGDLINAAVEVPSTNDATLEEELKVAKQLGLRGAPCKEVFINCNNVFMEKIVK